MRIILVTLAVCLVALGLGIARAATKGVARAPACIELRDQFDAPQSLAFPATNVVILTIADRGGSEQIDGWVAALKARYAGRIELRGVADVASVPGFLRAKVRRKFQETRTHPVMMDWSGQVCAQFGLQPGLANVLVIARDGIIQARAAGPAREAALKELSAAIDAALIHSPSVQTSSTPKPTPFRVP